MGSEVDEYSYEGLLFDVPESEWEFVGQSVQEESNVPEESESDGSDDPPVGDGLDGLIAELRYWKQRYWDSDIVPSKVCSRVDELTEQLGIFPYVFRGDVRYGPPVRRY